MFDPLLHSPIIVGALIIVGLLLELGLGRIGFAQKGASGTFDPKTRKYELKVGPVIGVFLLGGLLVIVPIVVQYYINKGAFYVSGTVRLSDGAPPPAGVSVVSCYPIKRLASDHSFEETVFRDEHGKFPHLGFELHGYYTETINLNDTNKVISDGSGLILRDPVIKLREEK